MSLICWEMFMFLIELTARAGAAAIPAYSERNKSEIRKKIRWVRFVIANRLASTTEVGIYELHDWTEKQFWKEPLTSCFSSLFCSSILVRISFIFVSRTIPPITSSFSMKWIWIGDGERFEVRKLIFKSQVTGAYEQRVFNLKLSNKNQTQIAVSSASPMKERRRERQEIRLPRSTRELECVFKRGWPSDCSLNGTHFVNVENQIQLADILKAFVQRFNEDLGEFGEIRTNDLNLDLLKPSQSVGDQPETRRTCIRSRMPSSLSDESTQKTK